MPLKLPATAPRYWPRFRSPLRSTALTARLGRVLGICFGICFVTGLLSHYQYQPWSWLPGAGAPGVDLPRHAGRARRHRHVCDPAAVGQAVVGLPEPVPLAAGELGQERGRALVGGVLVASALVQLFTGFFNALNWYPWSWSFVPVHRFLAYVVIGSILLHIAIKLPDIKYGLRTKLADGDVLTEKPWRRTRTRYSNNEPHQPPPPTDRDLPARRADRHRRRHRRGRGDERRADAHPARTDRIARDPAVEQRSAAGAGQPHRRPGPGERSAPSTRIGSCTSRARDPFVLTTRRPGGLAATRRTSRSRASRGGASAPTGAGCACSTSCGGPAGRRLGGRRSSRSSRRVPTTSRTSTGRRWRMRCSRPTSTASAWMSTTAIRCG